LKEESSAALKLVKDEAAKTIEDAKQLAHQIEEKARRTAARISVEAAQEQFRLAQTDLKKQLILWGSLSGVAVIAFLLAAWWMSHLDLPKGDAPWHMVYFAAIRITILTAVGAVAAFCLKILRAHMHMYQHNLHRQRVAKQHGGICRICDYS